METLVESGAKSQSDKRFATSWTNLIKDIEKAAKLSYAHGSKPSTLSDEEWALVLSHRSRGTTGRARRTVKKTMAAKKQPQPRLRPAKSLLAAPGPGAQPRRGRSRQHSAPTAPQRWAPLILT